jgi:hypothetical protein
MAESISARDRAILQQVHDLKLMSGGQIQSVHFPVTEHASVDAAARACRRTLRRLTRLQVLSQLERRIGGVRGGSAGFVYGISSIGHRLIDDGEQRHRYREPSATFVHHTLAVSQLVVDLVAAQRTKRLEILRLESEPRCWRYFNTVAGTEALRPDLFVAVGVGEFEHHWFIEMDMGTETLRRRLAKCRVYDTYYRTGIEQERRGIFPKVLWTFERSALAAEFDAAVARARGLSTEVFETTTHGDTVTVVAAGDAS